MADNDNPLKDVIPHDPRLEYQALQEQKRLTFEADQERKRQMFEERLEKQKAKRDWMMLIITFAAVAAAYWAGWEAHKTRLDALEALHLAQRPFVGVNPKNYVMYDLKINDKKERRVNGTYTIKYVGNTPSFNIRLTQNCTVTPNPYPDYTRLHEELSSIRVMNFSGEQEFGCTALRNGSDDSMNRNFFITGEILYDDFFRVRHHTRFCFHADLREFPGSSAQLPLYNCDKSPDDQFS